MAPMGIQVWVLWRKMVLAEWCLFASVPCVRSNRIFFKHISFFALSMAQWFLRSLAILGV